MELALGPAIPTDAVLMDLALGPAILLNEPHERAIEWVTAALKEQGFGVLTRIDLHAAFLEKLGVVYKPHTILGACNPPLAHLAVQAEPSVALMLPCNVAIEQAEGGGSLVSFANPVAMLGAVRADSGGVLTEVAEDAKTRLQRVAAALRRSQLNRA